MTVCVLIRRVGGNRETVRTMPADGRIPYWPSYPSAYAASDGREIALEAPTLEDMAAYLGVDTAELVAA